MARLGAVRSAFMTTEEGAELVIWGRDWDIYTCACLVGRQACTMYKRAVRGRRGREEEERQSFECMGGVQACACVACECKCVSE